MAIRTYLREWIENRPEELLLAFRTSWIGTQARTLILETLHSAPLKWRWFQITLDVKVDVPGILLVPRVDRHCYNVYASAMSTDNATHYSLK
jgi:hypothetical protein